VMMQQPDRLVLNATNHADNTPRARRTRERRLALRGVETEPLQLLFTVGPILLDLDP
jgi:hypothetical protein